MNKYLIEVIAAAFILAGVTAAWFYHDHLLEVKGKQEQIAIDQKARNEQKALDDQKITEAETAHAKEIADIQTQYSTSVTATTVVCHSVTEKHNVSETAVRPDQSGSPGNGGQSTSVHPNIEPALRMLAERLDTLNADARQLNDEVK